MPFGVVRAPNFATAALVLSVYTTETMQFFSTRSPPRSPLAQLSFRSADWRGAKDIKIPGNL